MGSLGFSELLVVSFVSAIYVIPIGIAIWVIITLRRIRADQLLLMSRIEAIEKLLVHSKS